MSLLLGLVWTCLLCWRSTTSDEVSPQVTTYLDLCQDESGTGIQGSIVNFHHLKI
jgi:hypothetical protein